MAPTKRFDSLIFQDTTGNPRDAQVVVPYGPDGTAAFDKKQYTLLTNQAAVGNGPSTGPISGGDYIWRAEAANWNGATATLQYLGLDGVTWFNVKDSANADVALTANGSKGVGIAQGSFLRVAVAAAAPTAMNSAVGGL